MKYLITESQLDKVIFRYLNNQDFIQIEKDNKIYFVNSENDEFGKIRYNKNTKDYYVDYKLIKEVSSFFSLKIFQSQEVIKGWVENTLQMKVRNFGYTINGIPHELKIPN